MELRADSLTATARRWLRTSSNPRILHIFSTTLNLVNERAEIASVIAAGLDRTAFSIRLDQASGADLNAGFTDLLDPKAKVDAAEDSLRVGPISVSVTAVDEWDPMPDWVSLQAAVPMYRQLEPLIGADLFSAAPPGGLADLWRARTSAARDEPLLKAAGPPARELQESVRDGCDVRLGRAASDLAGLGSGLTPSGDDLLVGAIHALYLRLERSRARQLGQMILNSAAGRTTLISLAWLGAAARGEASESWHRLLGALAVGQVHQVGRAARQLMELGHTSGADGLAGFLLMDQALASRETWIAG